MMKSIVHRGKWWIVAGLSVMVSQVAADETCQSPYMG